MHPLSRRATIGLTTFSLSLAAGLAPVAAHAVSAPGVSTRVGTATTTSSTTATTTSTTTAAKPGWTATATKGIGFKGTRLGATPDATPLRMDIVLTPRHQAAMAAALKAVYDPSSASFHHFLSPAQFRARYAPTSAQTAEVASYLRSQGLRHLQTSSNHLMITATGTTAHAEKAFATRLVSYRVQGHRVFANRTPAMVPAALGALVSSVSGLNDYSLHTTAESVRSRATQAAGSPSTAGLYPAQFRTTYDATGTADGSHASIAILTEGDISQVITDLRTAESKESLPQVPVSIQQVGPQGDDVAGVDEWDLDTQSASGMAGNLKQMYLYNATTLGNADIVAGINRFVSDDKATALSASIGECELFASLSGDEAAVDTVMKQGALQGQSLFASSGDEGSACSLLVNLGAPVGVPSVEWPAAGTYTTAVGGTSLVADAQGNRIAEPAWLGGGGGTSLVEKPGPWTRATDPLYAAALRAVPDIALDADPDTAPAILYVDGQLAYVGGTSLSSPLMLGVWARLESAKANHLGLASPALYGVYTKINPGTTTPVTTVPTLVPKPVPGFYDVILGTNGLYQAKPGWDYTTGLGAPDVKALVTALP